MPRFPQKKRYDIMKEVVETKQVVWLEGYEVDIQSANLYCKIYDLLNDFNKLRMENDDLFKVMSVCWAIAGKQRRAK